MSELLEFDVSKLLAAMDAERLARELSWQGVADEMWNLSAELNQRRPRDHPISATTITGMATRRSTSCQHALFMLRWLARTPESFLAGTAIHAGELPAAGPDRRLRWDLARLSEALDRRRRDQDLTWSSLADQLRATKSQVTGIRTAKFAIEMNLAMRIVQWLDRPAADFIVAASW